MTHTHFFSAVTIFVALAVLIVSAEGAGDAPVPPVAKAIPHDTTLHGERRRDDYFWLRDKTNPEVIRYLEAENQYTAAVMKHTEALQQQLYKEILGRIKETDLSVPERIGDYYYYNRTQEGQQYPIYCRKKGSLKAEEEVLLDENRLADGRKYMRIGAFRVSPDHKLLAYSTDTDGSESYTLHVKDLASDKLLPDLVPGTYYGLEWAADNRTLFYTKFDSARRPYQLFRHRLGADPAQDALLYQENDERFFLEIERTRSRQYLILSADSKTSSEVRYLRTDQPDAEFKLVAARRPEIEYDVEHHGDKFFITTNENAKNFKLMEAPVSDPSTRNWKEVIPHRASVKLDGVHAFENYLVISERDRGLRSLRVKDLKTGQIRPVEFPEPVYTVALSGNPEFHTSTVRFTYQSLVTPRSVFDYDMTTRQRVLQKQYEVLGGYDPAQYQSERAFATAADGTKIPISVVYRKGITRDGKNPLLLYGYGSYGLSTEPAFASDRLSLLDRGFIYAIAHIRGGGEMGRPWYESGKLLNKRNTFTDFIACAEHLIAQKYTSQDRLVIRGGSAGGLLMGAVMNMRPDLFRVVIAKVPFVDAINTMLDESLPLTVTEFEEWGNPKEEKYYKYMKTYSPYDNVAAKAYPNMLVTTGLSDPRVSYWEPSKWVAKLRRVKTDKNTLLMKIDMGSGHGGASGRYDRLKETALEYAFILEMLGPAKR